MHVIVATDGSKQSLTAAKYLKTLVDPARVTDISVIAVVRPLAAVGFADDLSAIRTKSDDPQFGSFQDAAQHAVQVIADALADWGPKVHKRVRSGSPANEIIKPRGGGERQPRHQRDGAARQHRPAGPAVRPVPRARRPPDPSQAADGREEELSLSASSSEARSPSCCWRRPSRACRRASPSETCRPSWTCVAWATCRPWLLPGSEAGTRLHSLTVRRCPTEHRGGPLALRSPSRRSRCRR
jgi:hypothetical protein